MRLVFQLVGDRWQHAVALRGPDGWQPLLASIEGSPEQLVPPSPTFQELRLERIDAETAEFQVFGRAGHGVYSAAIRVSGADQSIDFDVAARATRTEGALCCSSRYASPHAALERGSAMGAVQLAWHAACLQIAGGEESRVAVLDATAGAAQGLEVGQAFPDVGKPAKNPRNARWRYRFVLARQP